MIAFYKLLAYFLGFMFPVFLTKAIREILKENGGEQKYCDVQYMLWGNNIYNYGASP